MKDFVFWLVPLLVAGWLLSAQAGRLDRLHNREATLRAALSGQLANRAAAVLELADALDVASGALLSQAAHEALHGGEASQSALTDLVATFLADPDDVAELLADESTKELVLELARGFERVRLARRFHADAVTDILRLRQTTLVRAFRLAGHAPLPTPITFNDQIPRALADLSLSGQLD